LLLPSFWWLLATLGIHWFVAASLHLHETNSLHVSFVCSHIPFVRAPVIGLGPPLIQCTSSLIKSAETYFQRNLSSQVPSRHECEGPLLNPGQSRPALSILHSGVGPGETLLHFPDRKCCLLPCKAMASVPGSVLSS
jgi:hypothetical protein